MPQYDAYHEVVKTALIKDGWIITHDPLAIKYKGLRLFVDLGAEKLSSDNKSNEKIAVEIKVFGGLSSISEFEKAVGQYRLYRDMLVRTRSNRELYLAVTLKTFEKFFQKPAIKEFVADEEMNFLVFDHEKEEVVKWIK